MKCTRLFKYNPDTNQYDGDMMVKDVNMFINQLSTLVNKDYLTDLANFKKYMTIVYKLFRDNNIKSIVEKILLVSHNPGTFTTPSHKIVLQDTVNMLVTGQHFNVLTYRYLLEDAEYKGKFDKEICTAKMHINLDLRRTDKYFNIMEECYVAVNVLSPIEFTTLLALLLTTPIATIWYVKV